MSNYIKHPYHLVDESPWPLLAAIAGLGIASGLVSWFHEKLFIILLLRVFLLLVVCSQWWRDVSREGRFQGLHSSIVEKGLRWGIILFIVSEVIFFLSFFWAFFHRSLAPNIELGSCWPPIGVEAFNPFGVPLLNTIILLSSGVTVTWSHHRLIENNHSQGIFSLILTVLLGAYFTAVQGLEYIEARFAISDSVYGSRFFVATGFHGLHVLVGTRFLGVTVYRLFKGSLRGAHHFGFEAAAWYWHFVDVVWLFLFVRIYWWGGA
jgi:cytochrome c oxidase subunit 3